MKIYLDLVLLLNFGFDLILLLSVSIILKRNVLFRNILLGSLLGSISVIFLFLNITSLELFIYKIITSLVMVIVSFNYKNIKYTLKNIGYLYMNSIILGGFLYLLNIEFSYKNKGIVFYNNGLSINFVFLIILSPIIIYIYIKQIKEIRLNYSLYYKVNIYYKNKVYKLNGYLDTGNKLIDPITKKPVVIVNKNIIKKVDKYRFIPFRTIEGDGIIRCISADVEINKKIKKNALIGFKNIKMEGIDCIINQLLVE